MPIYFEIKNEPHSVDGELKSRHARLARWALFFVVIVWIPRPPQDFGV